MVLYNEKVVILMMRGVYYRYHKIRKENKIIVASTLLIGIILSVLIFNTPYPNTTDDTIFNVQNASEYISEIAKDEHSVYDEVAHEEVRLYLKGKLEEYIGSENVVEYNYDRETFPGKDLRYDVKNLLGVIPGESDTAILIMAHYDSRGHLSYSGDVGQSYGAADDGYGLAVMLEIARLYGERDLKNTIYLLMTDAEETGLHGSSRAVQEDFVDNVGFVINVEARGNKGPVYMFETSDNNEKVIDFYSKSELPVAYSFATEIYNLMPNLTDLTYFLRADKAGINFAVINGMMDYHTPEDSYANINASSIEHYGRQVIPLVEEFVTNEKYSDVDYFQGEKNQTFFTFLPNVLIVYSEGFGQFLNVILLMIGIAVAVTMVRNRRTSKGNLMYVGINLLFNGLLMYGAAFLISNMVAYMSNVPFKITYVRAPLGYIPSIVMVLFVIYRVYMIYSDKCDSEDSRKAFIISGVLINLIIAVVLGYFLGGLSFFFLMPGVTGLLLLLIDQKVKDIKIKQILFSSVMIFSLVLFIPIMFSLYIAITVGGLAVICAALIVYLWVYVPIVHKQLHLK